MLRPGVVLRAGGGDPALGHVSMVDMNGASPSWRAVAPLNFPRRRMNLTILADGTAIALGGTRSGDDESQAVLDSEIWNPTTETWTTVAPMAEARMYHSSAVLLDDGRVLVAGGEAAGRLRAQIYSPAYLFNGARPTIASAPSTIGYGSSFNLASPDAGSITSVALIRDAAATHAFDQNQRYVPLAFSASGGGLSVTAPSSGSVAPPGFTSWWSRTAPACRRSPATCGSTPAPTPSRRRSAAPSPMRPRHSPWPTPRCPHPACLR